MKLTTTVRLSSEARLLLEDLSAYHGLSHTAILETAIREKARREKPPQRKLLTHERQRREAPPAP